MCETCHQSPDQQPDGGSSPPDNPPVPSVSSMHEAFRRKFGPELDEAVERLTLEVRLWGRDFDFRLRRRVRVKDLLVFLGWLTLVGAQLLQYAQR